LNRDTYSDEAKHSMEGGVTTAYLYDGLDIVKETDGLGNTRAWYVRTLNIDEFLTRISADDCQMLT
jgi:hypothetical protein